MLGVLFSLIKSVPDTIDDVNKTRQHDFIDNMCGLYDEFEYQSNDSFAIYDKIEMLEGVEKRQEEEVNIKKELYINEYNLYYKIPYWEREEKSKKETSQQERRMLNAKIAYNKAVDRQEKTKVRILELKEKAGCMEQLS